MSEFPGMELTGTPKEPPKETSAEVRARVEADPEKAWLDALAPDGPTGLNRERSDPTLTFDPQTGVGERPEPKAPEQPEAPPAERQPEPQQAEQSEPPRELSPEQAVAYLMGHEPEPLTPEQAQAEQVEQTREALQSGEAVKQVAQATGAYNGAIKKLVSENPGIDSEDAVEAMDPIWQGVREIYGDEIASSPEVLRQVYEAVGGSEKFGPAPPTEAELRDPEATPEGRAYAAALKTAPESAFSR